MEIEDNTVVDLYNLHTEWQRQASLRREAGDEQADVANELRNKKIYIKKRRSDIALEYKRGIRSILDTNEKPVKLALPDIANAVESDEEIYKLEQEANVLQKKVDICTNYTIALDVKKYALQDEVRLYLGGYFADPVDFTRNSGNYIKEITEIKEKEEEVDERAELKRRRRKKTDG
jgi:hypothetical protein